MGRKQISPVFVDTRYAGDHGIARYAREVVTRLTPTWSPFNCFSSPAKPVDAINLQRLSLPRSALLYSPGYSSGLARCTQLLTIHDLTHLRERHFPTRYLNGAYYNSFVKPAVLRAQHVITVSETSADDVREWLNDERVQVHNAGIGCSSAFTRDGPACNFRRPYFLYVGNFKPHKNPRPVFEAMTAFHDHLIVVVSADATSARTLAQHYGLLNRLKVLTAVSDAELASLYRGAEALVFPSRWEGFGLPVLEALMTGTKVIYCSGARSVAELCSHGQFAIGDWADAAEFRSQMALAIDSEFACEINPAQFSWDAVASRVESLINHVRSLTSARITTKVCES